jgi:predicted metal-dependent hydrolase
MPVAPAGPRRIELNGVAVDYQLQRSARRSLALRVDQRGVRVGAPLALPLREVEGFLREHADWLLDKLAQRASRPAPELFRVEEGAGLPVFGEAVRLRLDGSGRTHRWAPHPEGGEALVLPAGQAERALLRALEARALPWFRERVAEHCQRLGLPAPPVRLTRARTRWGSCSRRTGIRLHWRLVHLAPELIDYVVAHEVAHLREMNHSPRFWAVVESLCPHWRGLRRELRRAAAGLPLIVPGHAGIPTE